MKKTLLVLAFLLALWVAVSAAARHAYFLPKYGSALNFISPPNDIWLPLASAQVHKGVRKYKFTFSHKYPGNHEVKVSIPRQRGLEPLPAELTVTLEIEEKGQILMKRRESGSSFWGIDHQGASYCQYSFPEDVSLRENVVCQVLIEGDVDLLLDRYEDVIITIGKASDK
jgi:hypothetical protein